MAEEILNDQIEEEEVDTPEEEEAEGEHLFTQEEVNQLIEARLSRERKKSQANSRIKTLTTERDTARRELAAKEAELEQHHREVFLQSLGVPAEDTDYYAFKIGKLVTDETTFEDAAKEYFKDGRGTVRVVNTGANINGGKAKPSGSTNDIMNNLIKGVHK